jgi:polynucleotide 5'-hydroxyl-kinase GRC3/NOL9
LPCDQGTFIQGEEQLRRTVEAGKTLLVDGPASVKLCFGKVMVFGGLVARPIIVRDGKRLPFFVQEKAEFEVLLGQNALVQEVDGDTVPESWVKVAQTVLSTLNKRLVVMVLGKADSGKSSFCTYLLNCLVSAKRKVAVLDGDMGQSDIGPPCTVDYAVTTKSVTELYELQMDNTYFVGVTSPVRAIAKTLDGINALIKEIVTKQPDVVIVNSDGWVLGEDAVKYKTQLAHYLKPDLIVALQMDTELEPLLDNLKDYTITKPESSNYTSQRNPDKRKKLRQINYAKYLQGAKPKTFNTTKLTIQEPKNLPKTAEEQKGLLVGFTDAQGKFLGIGVLLEFNKLMAWLKISTAVSNPAAVILGKEYLE